mmetsp:Transcript_33239/g.43805  ORF Transcript_33239/g.43805 Transcript_33239/m.43805 type:complete len:461 (-) Transcript_33239:326-1708(-)|eukprot:CAMPEP_0117750816 /NCGR_PEP_ID=MMETSP0947-20121206/10605_1 /TAXON_ID=44440 /ORGANISM="Chattonella subsalsa, Strain CCMP2191" /LENGTH=460 /DNA_ID=CAMNT_0005569079 /DNA_START=90 /DNA_END=1472 /DNA_ORIENTATION=+
MMERLLHAYVIVIVSLIFMLTTRTSGFSLTVSSTVSKSLAEFTKTGESLVLEDYELTEDRSSTMHPAQYLVNKAEYEQVLPNAERVIREGKLFRYANKNPEDNECALLEKEFQDTFGFDHALSLNSCSSAILLGLISMGMKPGDKVLMPAFTFVAVPSSVVWAQGEVVLCEIDDNYALDLDDLEKKIESSGSRFLLMSYMRGHIPDMDRLKRIVEKYDLQVLEDCAHALGIKWRGEQVGKLGRCAAFSTQSNKIIDAGEGGILASDDPEIIIKSTLLSGCYEANIHKHFDLGKYSDMVNELLGTVAHFNFRMANVQAALIRPQIAEVEERSVKHNENFKVFETYLNQEEMKLPSLEAHTRPSLDSLQIQVNKLSESQLRSFLSICQEQGIPMGGFLDNNARAFWNWKFLGQDQCEISNCPKTHEIVSKCCDLRLPHQMTEAQTFDLVQRLNRIYEQVKTL